MRSPDETVTRGFEIVEKGQRIAFVTIKNDDVPMIGYIEVARTHRRRGLGTRLYVAAAKEACRWLCMPLHSDTARTANAQAFWEKQARKGRATCERQVPANTWASQHDLATESILGRGGCWRYKLTCPAPATLDRARG